MNEYINRIENGNYELVIRCSDYENFKSFEKLLMNELTKTSKEKECSSYKCKADKEMPKYEKDIKSDIPDFTALNIDKTNNFGIMWAFIIIIIIMVFLCSGNNNNYYKEMCDAYEPNKKEENMQKAREALAKLKKSLENLTNGEIK